MTSFNTYIQKMMIWVINVHFLSFPQEALGLLYILSWSQAYGRVFLYKLTAFNHAKF